MSRGAAPTADCTLPKIQSTKYHTDFGRNHCSRRLSIWLEILEASWRRFLPTVRRFLRFELWIYKVELLTFSWFCRSMLRVRQFGSAFECGLEGSWLSNIRGRGGWPRKTLILIRVCLPWLSSLLDRRKPSSLICRTRRERHWPTVPTVLPLLGDSPSLTWPVLRQCEPDRGDENWQPTRRRKAERTGRWTTCRGREGRFTFLHLASHLHRCTDLRITQLPPCYIM